MRRAVKIDGAEYTVWSENIRGQVWIHFQGRTFIFEPENRKKFGSKAAGAVGTDILSPMPGKITKIVKSAGEKVSKGEAVVVMEAMKMEYTLKSEVAGTIEKIDCKLGDQVPLGKLLAKIKPD